MSKVAATVGSSYGHMAGLIGTTVLVFPGDSRIDEMKEAAQLQFDSFGRPLEFFVAFYSPRLTNDDDNFFLFPGRPIFGLGWW